MKLSTNSLPTNVGPAQSFTGAVYVDTVKNPDEQSAISCAHVHFTPGARTVWHSHPKGQTLYVTDGQGLVGTRDGLTIIRPGDSVFIEPNEEHWHGGCSDRFMAHVAITEVDENGSAATWGELVADDEYAQVPINN